MAHKYDHLREKAIKLRTEQKMPIDEIVECLKLPKTTIYEWIKDVPIPFTQKQLERQQKGTAAMQAKFAALREDVYQQGLAEAPDLLKNLSLRDFVVLYMAEGYKRNRNTVSFVNSEPQMVRLAVYWICFFANPNNKIEYSLQYHADHDVEELKRYWGDLLGISPDVIKAIRKSNSGQLAGRRFRSEYGLLTIRVGDTYFRARLQAWMDFIKAQW